MIVRTNSNKKFADEIRKSIKANDGYCPCALVKDEDHKCMCKEFIESEELGPCKCGLYYKEEV